ncbi:MAG: hypothetical protein IIA50_05365, partial [Bacteroidetes bacterium]|nr:hypothetical protein [Bacteroidota bacterium]
MIFSDYTGSVVVTGRHSSICVHVIALIAACLLVMTVVPAALAQHSFTIEQILSAPHPSGLRTSSSGQRVAWVFSAEGVRNIWVAEAPDFMGRQLTTYTEDDGQTIGSLSFTPDEHHIIYRRGDGPNGKGELPNPLNLSEGTIQAIYVIAVDGGEPRKLAEGSSPALDPRGGQVAYLKSGKVWIVALDGSEEPKPLFKSRGRANSL